MGDLGGGSLELVELNGGKLGRSTTLPLAPLRLIESCGDDRQQARRTNDKTLATVDWLAEGRGRACYTAGGTCRHLAVLIIQHPHTPPPPHHRPNTTPQD